MTMCHEKRTAIGEVNGRGIAASLPCHRWGCPDCVSQCMAKLTRLIRELWPTLFVTLTSNPHWHGSPDERAQRLSHSWSLIRGRLRRRYVMATITIHGDATL